MSARVRAREPKFYYTMDPSNLSIGKLHKCACRKSPIIVQHYPLTFGSFCDRILVSRGESEDYFPRPLVKKNVKNLLTNGTRCAIMSMSRGEHTEILPYELVETETLRIETKTH